MNRVPEINIPASKSISNRLLILAAQFPGSIQIKNLSTARDTVLLKNALESDEHIRDVKDAGTAFRFLTAFLPFHTPNPVTLTGSERMKQRPVGALVEALRHLGAKIEYLEKEGFPPLRIFPSSFISSSVEIRSDVSSQFISALMLVGMKNPGGLTIHLKKSPVSVSYIQMTASMMHDLDIDVQISKDKIYVPYTSRIEKKVMEVEPDWSAASYFFSYTSVTGKPVLLLNFKPHSVQGDRHVVEIYKKLGVENTFTESGLFLKQKNIDSTDFFEADFLLNPDLAQTVAVTCLARKKPCRLTGLKTLRVKETDRIQALKNELKKFGAKVEATDDSLEILPPKNLVFPNEGIVTYKDHRMTMSFAVMQKIFPELVIHDKNNVVKSFPGFWKEWNKLG